MSTQHALGPVKRLGGILFDVSTGKQVGAVYQSDDRGNRINSDGVDEANADLFAAAPDLLRAAKIAYELLFRHPGTPNHSTAMTAICAAIAKAECAAAIPSPNVGGVADARHPGAEKHL